MSIYRNDPNRVIARIRIDAETPVRTDSVAELNFLGITGVTFIQIRAGSPDQPLLVPEDFQPPPVIKTERTALDELFQGGQDLLTVTGETINRLNDALSEENVAHFTAILANLETASEKIAADGGLIDSAQAALKSLDKAATTIDAAATSVNATVDAVDDDVIQLVAEAKDVVAALQPAADNVRETIENINGAVEQINKDVTPSAGRALEQISSAAVDIRAMMVRIQSLLNEIEQDPSRFVYRQPLPTE
jgi:phospholipid/cholesterol/gamma-HCH transport system substrate-binding protein